jgi:hypothetical protein
MQGYSCPAINPNQSNPSIEGQISCLDGGYRIEPQLALLANGEIVMSEPS